jgi:hypothetical protein
VAVTSPGCLQPRSIPSSSVLRWYVERRALLESLKLSGPAWCTVLSVVVEVRTEIVGTQPFVAGELGEDDSAGVGFDVPVPARGAKTGAFLC